jgi:hypothetical protein
VQRSELLQQLLESSPCFCIGSGSVANSTILGTTRQTELHNLRLDAPYATFRRLRADPGIIGN